MKTNILINIALIFSFAGIVALKLYSCTGIKIVSKDKSVIYGRTLEFGKDLDSNILFAPRKHGFEGASPIDNTKGLKWESKYAVVGANMLGLNYFADGINEKGLAGGVFYFPDYTELQNVSLDQVKFSMAGWQLLTWILTTCCSIKEVKIKLPKIKVNRAVLPKWNAFQPVHYIIHDQVGNSLVIEYINGQLRMHDNKLGVLTNSPSFEWHTTNLNNYVNLSALNVPKKKLSDITLVPFGQGSGMLGLPGDFTPPSRFVRAVAFSQAILPSETGAQDVDSAFHILNLFDIPKGVVRGLGDNFDYTQWTSVSDLRSKKYYFHTYGNRQVYTVDLNKLKNTKKVLTIPMKYEPKIIDVTPKEDLNIKQLNS